jgi:hypothetical protein
LCTDCLCCLRSLLALHQGCTRRAAGHHHGAV